MTRKVSNESRFCLLQAHGVKEVDTCLTDKEGSGQECEDEVGFSEDKGDGSDESW